MTTFEPAGRPTAYDPSPYAKGTDRSFLELDTDGRPLIRLEWWNDELWLADRNDLIVPCDRPGMTRLGLFGFDVRGIKYHQAAARSGDFRPGSDVLLVRDHDNVHDRNAVAVRARGSEQIVGYVNKGKAGSVAKLLDKETKLAAVCLRGQGPGKLPWKIAVLAAEPELMAYVARHL